MTINKRLISYDVGGSPKFYSRPQYAEPFSDRRVVRCVGGLFETFSNCRCNGNQLPQAAESILRAGSLWASHSGKSLAVRAGKAGERIRRGEVKTNQTKLVLVIGNDH